MGRPKSAISLTKHTLNLFEGDFEFLQSRHPTLGAARVIRDIVRSYRRKLEADSPTVESIDLDSINIEDIDIGNSD